MSEKRFIVRYQVEIVANDLFEAIDKAEKYDELELYEIKQIFLKGDVKNDLYMVKQICLNGLKTMVK